MTNAELPTEFSKPARHILHPTDFTKESDVALAHALRLALVNRASLSLLHVGKDTDEEWDAFPSIRQILQGWGVIAEGASQSDVTDLGIEVEKVIYASGSVTDSIAQYCQRHPIDMIVLATAGRDGLAAWLKPSKAERIAETVSTLSIPTLFVPAGHRGCVELKSGEVSMAHVLVPVDHKPDSESAIELGLRAIAMFGSNQAKLTLLHVGTESRFPKVYVPDGPWKIERVARTGNAAAEILAFADECAANLIIMVTEGPHGYLDVLRGTTTAQVLRNAPCPLLAIPSGMQNL
jgi:nucleotide-binding universal stress UspA family protein